MDADGPDGRSHEELPEPRRRRQEEVAERDAAIERRDEKMRELDEELARPSRPSSPAESSSVPPWRGLAANRAERRGPMQSPKRGHLES